MDISALAGIEDSLSCRHDWSRLRFLRRNGEACTAMVAEPRARVALPVAQGAAPHVAALRGGECEVLEECEEGEAQRRIGLMVEALFQMELL